jgi:hypothetical protein
MSINIENRQAPADILKVMAITAVVFIHGSSLIPCSPYENTISAYTYEVNHMFRFCVPIFVFLWAYFQEKSLLKKVNTSLLYYRFYLLLIPFFFWSLIYFLLTGDFKTLTFSNVLTKHWTGFGWSGQYYFIILFQLIVLYPAMRCFTLKLAIPLPMMYIISLLFYVTISYSKWFNTDAIGKIGDRPFIYWIPYVILGITHAHRNIFPVKIPLVLGLTSTALIAMEFHWFNLREVSIYLHPSVFISSFILLSYLALNVGYSSLNRPIAWVIQITAKNTLGIFCLNPLVILLLLPILRSHAWFLKFNGASFVAPILSTVIILIICILFTMLLKRIRLGMLIAN